MKHLYESIFDDDIVTRKVNPEEYIGDFLKENYYEVSDHDIEIYKDRNKYIVNINTDFGVKYNCNLKSLTNEFFEFGKINGNFTCSSSKIESLKGAPKFVKGIFECDECENLTSLEGVQENVSHLFTCRGCDKLKSLKGAPKEANFFDCSYCPNLTSLEGAPKKCIEFDCSHCDRLTSLEGAPKYCDRFYCYECENLTTLKGAPTKTDIFHCANCPKLMSLKGLPKIIKQNLYCSGCGGNFNEEEINNHL